MKYFKTHSQFINEAVKWSSYEQRMVNQIKAAQKEKRGMYTLPMKTQDFYRKHKDILDESINEGRVAADRLLKDVVKGNTSEVEGIKLSKEMANAFLDWLKMSTYGKKFGKLPFDKLFTASFNWGLDRYIKGYNVKDEFKELKAKAKEMSKAVNEAFIGPFVFNDKMSDDELKAMYDGALDGYAYYAKGMQYSKSDYKKAYQEIEKILKKRGVSVNEAKVNEESISSLKTKLQKLDKDGNLTYPEKHGSKGWGYEDYANDVYRDGFKSEIEAYKDAIAYLSEGELNEASRRNVHKAAKQGSYPAVIVVVQDGKVIHQEPVSTPDVAPATFNVMQEKYPKALLHLEDKTGKRLFSESVTEAKFNKKSLMRAMKKDDGFIQLGNGQEYVIYNPNNGNDDNSDMWDDKVIFALDQDGGEHEIKYSDIVSYNEGLKINLKQDHLSSAEYQKAKKLKDFDKDDWEWNNKTDLYDKIRESEINEGKFDDHVDLVKSLHFEMDPKVAREMKIELGKRQGEYVERKQLAGGEYSLRRFRKEIKYDDKGTDLGVFRPGSYMAATSKLGDGPHKKKVKAKKWNQKMYDQWIEDVASNDGWKHAYDMAQNAKHEPGLLQWAKKMFRGEDPMQRIQWDIEAHAE